MTDTIDQPSSWAVFRDPLLRYEGRLRQLLSERAPNRAPERIIVPFRKWYRQYYPFSSRYFESAIGGIYAADRQNHVLDILESCFSRPPYPDLPAEIVQSKKINFATDISWPLRLLDRLNRLTALHYAALEYPSRGGSDIVAWYERDRVEPEKDWRRRAVDPRSKLLIDFECKTVSSIKQIGEAIKAATPQTGLGDISAIAIDASPILVKQNMGYALNTNDDISSVTTSIDMILRESMTEFDSHRNDRATVDPLIYLLDVDYVGRPIVAAGEGFVGFVSAELHAATAPKAIRIVLPNGVAIHSAHTSRLCHRICSDYRVEFHMFPPLNTAALVYPGSSLDFLWHHDGSWLAFRTHRHGQPRTNESPAVIFDIRFTLNNVSGRWIPTSCRFDCMAYPGGPRKVRTGAVPFGYRVSVE